MRPERKKEIRSLTKVIPQLVKSGLVNQAFETERIIASTFEFSDEFISKLVGIPQNYIESIQEIYADILNKAYSTGYKSAEIKITSTPINLNLAGEELTHEIDIRMPMAFGVKTQLMDIFRESVAKYFETVPNGLEEVTVQFDKDLHATYVEGVKDFLASAQSNAVSIEDKVEEKIEQTEFEPPRQPEPSLTVEVSKQEIALDATAKLAANLFRKYATNDLQKLFNLQASEGRHRANAKMMVEFSEWIANNKKANDYIPDETYRIVADTISKDLLNKLEKYAKLLGEGDAEMVLRFTLGLPPKGKKATAESKKDKEEKKEDKEEKEEDVVGDSTYARLEAYTKLLKSPEAERVLRYTLGLPPKSSVTASYRTLARQVGPYDSQALATKVQNLVKSHDYESGASQTVVVECLIGGINKLDDISAAKAIAEKLGIKPGMEDISLDYAERMADNIAAQLNVSTNLPGHFMFLDTPEGDFCLLYNFTRTEPIEEKVEEEDVEFVPALASLPNGPQGVLTKSEQSQIEGLLGLGKSKTYRDIKKVSPKLATYIGKVLNDIRMSKMPLADGIGVLRGNTEDLITDCFGTDGQSYYQYLKNH